MSRAKKAIRETVSLMVGGFVGGATYQAATDWAAGVIPGWGYALIFAVLFSMAFVALYIQGGNEDE